MDDLEKTIQQQNSYSQFQQPEVYSSIQQQNSYSQFQQPEMYSPIQQQNSYQFPRLNYEQKEVDIKWNASKIANYFILNEYNNIVKYRNALYFFNGRHFVNLTQKLFADYMYSIPNYVNIIVPQSLSILKDTYKKIGFYKLKNIPDNNFETFENLFVAFNDGIYKLSNGEFFNRCENYTPDSSYNKIVTPFGNRDPQDYFCTYSIRADYAYGQNYDCPNFNNFLNEISGGDQTLIDRIWEFIGYYLTPDMSKKCFVVLQGVGDSGKSVLGKFISTLFNYDAVDSISIRDFNTKDFPKKLINKHLLISMELNSGKLGSKIVENIKSATGNDMLSDGNTRFYNQCKLLFASNYPLITRDPAEELMKRFIPIPFKYEIPKDKLNPNIIETFIPERDAVVYKAMQAYQRLRANNYEFSGCFPKNDPELFPKANPYGYAIARFLQKYCLIGDKTKRELTDTLFQVFQKSEFFLYDITLEKFGKELNAVLECVYPKKNRARSLV